MDQTAKEVVLLSDLQHLEESLGDNTPDSQMQMSSGISPFGIN